MLVVVIVIVEVPCPPGVSGISEGLSAAKGPSADAGGAERVTVPEKPRLVTTIVDVAEPPAMNRASTFGEAIRVKP